MDLENDIADFLGTEAAHPLIHRDSPPSPTGVNSLAPAQLQVVSALARELLSTTNAWPRFSASPPILDTLQDNIRATRAILDRVEVKKIPSHSASPIVHIYVEHIPRLTSPPTVGGTSTVEFEF